MKSSSILVLALFVSLANTVNAQTPVKHSDEVLKEAYQAAANEDKNVFVMFHASWCGWCRKLDASMNHASVKDLFGNNYVITHLTVYESKDKTNLENPGALEFLTKYKGNDLGIPYWIILDKNGKWLADSQRRADGLDFNTAGENVGCPSSREEVNYFLKVLSKTSKLNAAQLETVEKRFLLNK
jgi:thioredoxin-related protein